MSRARDVVWLVIVFFLIAVLAANTPGRADDIYYRGRMSPNDYLLRSHDQKSDPVFDNSRVIDLSASIGVGSDCGKIDFKNTLQASLKNVLDTKYFEGLGSSII